ncbi:MAG: YggS family pyridoxal phosphate-dependent enzyme [Armatimonadota bacterium]
MHDSVSAQLIEDITQRLAEVRGEMADAAARAGRRPEDIRLVAVTKTHPASVLEAAVHAGVTEIGENYIQEAVDKFQQLGWPEVTAGHAPVIRHAIGRMQSNKVRPALRWFEMVQTVDSVELAQRIDRIAGELERTVSVLLEINISCEPTKTGFFSNQVEGVFHSLANLSHIQVDGLMVIGQFVPDPEAARAEFIAVRELRDRLRAVAPPAIQLHELSMGMSHDFPVAIEEGATIVRVGSRLFGPRV